MKGMCWWALFHGGGSQTADSADVLSWPPPQYLLRGKLLLLVDVASTTCCCYTAQPLQPPPSFGSADSHRILNKRHLGCCHLHYIFHICVVTFWPGGQLFCDPQPLTFGIQKYFKKLLFLVNVWPEFCNLVAFFRYSDGNCRQFPGRNKAARTSVHPGDEGAQDALRGHGSRQH